MNQETLLQKFQEVVVYWPPQQCGVVPTCCWVVSFLLGFSSVVTIEPLWCGHHLSFGSVVATRVCWQ